MAHTKAEGAGKSAKARCKKEHTPVTRTKKLEKRVAKLEKEKEEEKRNTKCWKQNILKEQQNYFEKILIARGMEAEEVTHKSTKSWQVLKALYKTLAKHIQKQSLPKQPTNQPVTRTKTLEKRVARSSSSWD